MPAAAPANESRNTVFWVDPRRWVPLRIAVVLVAQEMDLEANFKAPHA